MSRTAPRAALRPAHARLSTLSLLVGQALCPLAYAQGDAADKELVDLDAVKVVADKPQQRGTVGVLGARSLQDTPYSITAVSLEAIEQANPAVVADLFGNDASVSNNGQSGYGLFSDRISVRGLSISGSNNLVNGVRYYSWGSELPIEAVEQVQLLKGAGGFLYGFGAPGGILNFVTKTPTETPLLTARFGHESDSVFSSHLDASTRLGSDGALGIRGNAWHKEGESFNGSVVNGTGAALALQARVGERLLLSADVLQQDRRTNRTSPAIALNNFVDDILPSPIDGSTRLSSDDAYTASRFTTWNVGARWQLATDWSLELRSGALQNDYRYPYERLLLLNTAGDYNNRLFDGSNDSRYRYSRALLEGRLQTGPLYHHIVAGLDYQHFEDAYGLNTITLQRGSNINNPVTSHWRFDRSRSVPTWRTSRLIERSLFVSDTVELSTRWSVLAGLRHTRDRETSWNKQSSVPSGHYQTNATTPTVAVLFRPVEAATLYASYIESLESGGTVGDDYLNAGQQLQALVSKQYEVGGKWETQRWAGNVALFRLDRGATLVTADNRFTQDGIARYDGLEVSSNTRLGQAWSVGASAVALDARNEKNSVRWLLGRQPEGGARFTSALHAGYDVAAVPGLTLHGRVRYQGRTTAYNIPSRQVTLQTPAVTLATLGADYRTTIAERNVVFHAQLDNVFNREYWSAGASPTTNALSPGRPRLFTLSAKIDFL